MVDIFKFIIKKKTSPSPVTNRIIEMVSSTLSYNAIYPMERSLSSKVTISNAVKLFELHGTNIKQTQSLYTVQLPYVFMID